MGDPRAKLLQGTAWEGTRTQVCRTLGREATPERELPALQQQLHETYLRTAANLPTNTPVRIEQCLGQDTLVITGLERVVELTAFANAGHHGPSTRGLTRSRVRNRATDGVRLGVLTFK